LRQALATNPFLEEFNEEETTETEAMSSDADRPLEIAEMAETAVADGVEEPPLEPVAVESVEAYERPAEYSGDFPSARVSGPDDDRSDLGEWMRYAPDLREHLRHELAGYRLSERDHALVHVLIEALDDDGYL